MSADNALDADVDPECLRGMRETGELLASLGHHVVEDAPSLPGKDTLRHLHPRVRPRRRASGSPTASSSPAAPPEDDEIEPLSRALWELSRKA